MKKNLLSILCLVSLVGCNGVSTGSLPATQNSISTSSEVIASSSSKISSEKKSSKLYH